MNMTRWRFFLRKLLTSWVSSAFSVFIPQFDWPRRDTLALAESALRCTWDTSQKTYWRRRKGWWGEERRDGGLEGARQGRGEDEWRHRSVFFWWYTLYKWVPTRNVTHPFFCRDGGWPAELLRHSISQHLPFLSTHTYLQLYSRHTKRHNLIYFFQKHY